MAIRHKFTNAHADGSDNTLVQPSDWNDDHTVDADGLNMLADTTDPATPPTGTMVFYAKYLAGRAMPKFIGPSGVDSVLQPALFQNRVILWTPGTSTAPLSTGQTPTVAATCSHPTPVAGAIGTVISRAQFTTSTTAGNAAGLRSPLATVIMGDGTSRGGFFTNFRFNGGSLHTNGRQVAVGLTSNTATLAGEPSALADMVGMILDSGDTTWQFCRKNGSNAAVKVNLGVTPSANQLFDLTMFSAPGSGRISVRILLYNNDGTASTVLDASYNDNVPAGTTFLGLRFEVRNGALAAAHNIAMSRIYLESDF